MKEMKLLKAIGEVDEELILDAAPKKKKRKAPLFVGGGLSVACAVLAAVILLNNAAPNVPNVPNVPIVTIAPAAIFTAEYPAPMRYTEYPARFETTEDSDYAEQIAAHKEWYNHRREAVKLAQENSAGIYSLTETAAPKILADDGTNRVCSPLNLYEALAMLTEVTDGETRAQLLGLLGEDSAESLRKTAGILWDECYRDDSSGATLLANSIWLSGDGEYNPEALKAVCENYYASSYSGTFGSEEYNRLLQKWLNENTRSFLSESADSVKLPEGASLALASTVYFTARWENEFSPKNNTTGDFAAPSGTVSAEYMNSVHNQLLFWGDNFKACDVEYENVCGGKLRLILPDEGVTINELLSDPELYSFIGSKEYEKHDFSEVHLSLPKFDISNDSELSEALKSAGLTEIFGDNADFSPLFGEGYDTALSKVQHAVRVKIDEEGTEAAAFIVEHNPGAGGEKLDEVYMRFDRPFIFVVQSGGGLPLFMGVVNDPTAG